MIVQKKKQKKKIAEQSAIRSKSLSSRYTVNITPTEQTDGAAYPEANLYTKIGRKIVGDSGTSIFNCRPLHTPKIRWCSRTAARKCKQICVFVEASVIEKRLLCRATQKVSAVLRKVKKEKYTTNGRMVHHHYHRHHHYHHHHRQGGERWRKGKKKCSVQTRQRLSPTEAVSKLVKQRS